MSKKNTSNQLDSFDVAILKILQNDNKVSQSAIAERVGLSTPSVQRRISQLEIKGVIEKNVAVLNPLIVGNPITSIIECRLTEDRSLVMDRAKKYFHDIEEVQQCYFVNGGVSFVIIMLASNLSHFEQLVRMHFADNSDILAYKTLIVLDRVKTGLKIPLN